MCHLILLGPVLGLVLFWILPMAVALPLYAVIVLGSVAAYVAAIRAMRNPVRTGWRELEREAGVVVAVHDGEAQVSLHGEIWRAMAAEPLHPGDRIEVVGKGPGLALRVAVQHDSGLGSGS
jgi:membrane protein implicated in regulation of membrane protease activity